MYLTPRVPVRIIMRFGGYADPGRPYMFHCHLLFHEDRGMMGQFAAAGPGHHEERGAQSDRAGAARRRARRGDVVTAPGRR